MTRVRYHDAAIDEIEAAIAYYAERDVDLATRFHNAIRAAERLIAQAPSTYVVFDCTDALEIRRALLQDFPVAILFIETNDVTWVVAVMHLRREPGYWRERI